MHIKKYALASTMAASIAFVACTDANYDLSDIDTLARFNITDLKIPINVDEMILDSLLDIKEDSKIKRMKNGSYAVVVEDEVKESKEVKFDPINIKKPEVDPIKSTISHHEIVRIAEPGVSVGGNEEVINFDIPNNPSHINFNSETVDNAVQSIEAAEFKEGTNNLTINISFSNVSGVKSFVIEGLELSVPKGIELECDGADYDSENGTLKFRNKIESNSLNYNIPMKVIGFKNKGQVEFTPGYPKGDKDAKGTLKVEKDNEIKVSAGTLHVYGRNLEGYNGSTAPVTSVNSALACDNVGYETNVEFKTELTVDVFHGGLYYNVEGINVNSVDLTDLPSVLKETGTEIGLENPQLYLYINNPIMQKYPETKTYEDPYAVLNITPRTDVAKGNVYKSDKVKFGVAENYIVCAPNPENVSYKSEINPEYDFSNITTRSKFEGLSNILKYKDAKGEYRVPDSLAIDIDDPVFDTKVENFHLGQYGYVKGHYAFYAPVKMTKDSKIIYSDTVDINTDDIDKIDIYDLLVNAAITTSAPAKAVEATVYPLEKRYESMDEKARNARKEALKQVVKINGDAQGNINNSAFALRFTPGEAEPINGLSGLVFEVKVIASGNDDLKPSQTIKISQIKVAATGAYEEN